MSFKFQVSSSKSRGESLESRVWSLESEVQGPESDKSHNGVLKQRSSCFYRLSMNGQMLKDTIRNLFALSPSKPVVSFVEPGERGVSPHLAKSFFFVLFSFFS